MSASHVPCSTHAISVSNFIRSEHSRQNLEPLVPNDWRYHVGDRNHIWAPRYTLLPSLLLKDFTLRL